MTREILFLFALLWIAYLVITTWPVARRARRLEEIARAERERLQSWVRENPPPPLPPD